MFWYKYGKISSKAYFNTTHSKEWGDRKEEPEKDEAMKKPDIIQDYDKFMWGRIGHTKFCTMTYAAEKLWNGLDVF
jgi:hypothetical protein